MAELPLEESAETAKSGNYSPSLERILFKLLCFQFCVFFFVVVVVFKFWKQRVAIHNHCSQQSLIKLAETEIPLKPTEKDVLEVTRKAVPL